MAESSGSARSGYAVADSDGTPIYYSILNNADCSTDRPGEWPAIALCDGIGCDGFIWRYLREELSRRARVVHWHYRGHGRTPLPRDRRRVEIEDHADDLACVLDHAECERAVVFGHSMGVQVALETYRRHPARVAGLVLICGAPGTPLRTFGHAANLDRILPMVRAAAHRAPGVLGGVMRAILPTRLAVAVATRLEVNGALIEERDLMPYFRGIARVDIELFLDMLAAANRHSAQDLLSEIRIPTLIIAGDRDGFTPAALSRQMHEAIPGAEFVLLENGSHTAPIERPHLVGHTVAEFLDRRIARSAGD